jgi:hypothetical protein
MSAAPLRAVIDCALLGCDGPARPLPRLVEPLDDTGPAWADCISPPDRARLPHGPILKVPRGRPRGPKAAIQAILEREQVITWRELRQRICNLGLSPKHGHGTVAALIRAKVVRETLVVDRDGVEQRMLSVVRG